ncbi:MAG: hypothetical protein GKR99_12960 [Rhodobacteraceae bacterium]|nr:hypothetical protein [Paracoccaceae bacterium]
MNVWSVPRPDHPEILLAQYREAPSRHPLNTASGRIELYCERIASYGLPDVPPHPAWSARGEWTGDAAAGTYALLTPQPQEYLHSQLAQTGLARPAEVVMNADDASAAGLQDGDQVQVSSPRGGLQGRRAIDAGLSQRRGLHGNRPVVSGRRRHGRRREPKRADLGHANLNPVTGVGGAILPGDNRETLKRFGLNLNREGFP